MKLTIEGPLFAGLAKGTITGLGTFTRIGGTNVLSHRQYGRRGNVNAPVAIKQCFAVAKKQHSQGSRQWVWNGKKWVQLIVPSWPDYWNQWLVDNPDCLL